MKSEAASVDVSMFEPQQGRAWKEIPSPAVYEFLPEGYDCGCWPKHIWWQACRYIEKGDNLLFLIIMSCEYPKKDEPRFVDYTVLTTTKEGEPVAFETLQRQAYE